MFDRASRYAISFEVRRMKALNNRQISQDYCLTLMLLGNSHECVEARAEIIMRLIDPEYQGSIDEACVRAYVKAVHELRGNINAELIDLQTRSTMQVSTGKAFK